jgi:hypothetical protein
MTTPDPTLAARLAVQDLRIDCYHDKPTSGMWHCGPNSCWVQITHIPTQMTARAYHRNQWKARQAAMDCIEFMVSDYCGDLPQFPEVLSDQLITLADAETIVRAENEACAKVCDDRGSYEQANFGLVHSAQNYFRARDAIRARVKPHNNEVA